MAAHFRHGMDRWNRGGTAYHCVVQQSYYLRVAIVTDDFTSATDGTACFASRGWRCRVVSGSQSIPLDAHVLAIDTQSRTQRSEFGQSRILGLCATLRLAQIVIKQFDSTVRGHVADESLATLRSSNRRALLVLAAFPAAGRTTVSGVQLWHGTPVHLTEFANDACNPVRASSLVDLFGAVAKSVRSVRSVAEAREALGNTEAVIVDAESEEQLDEFASEFWCDSEIAWAGSTGLVRALARVLPDAPGPSKQLELKAQRPLLLVGSLHSESRHQLARFSEDGGTVVELDPLGSLDSAVERVLAMSVHKKLALTAQARRVDPALAAPYLAGVARRLFQAGAFDGLFVTGGDTAHHVLQAIGVESIDVLCEVEAGVPHCIATSGYGLIPFISKAGAFGSADIMNKAIDVLGMRPAA